MTTNCNFAELKQNIKTWSNDHEDILIRKIKQLSDNYVNQSEDISKSIKELETNISKVEISYFNNLNTLKNMSIRKFVEHSISNDVLEFKKTKENRQEPT